MQVLFSGTARVPTQQITMLLLDLSNSVEEFNFKVQEPIEDTLSKVLSGLSDGTNVASEPYDTIVLAWDGSDKCFELLKYGRENNIPVLDITNWLDELYLPQEDIYHCE